jgi:hypothetical protein
MEEKIEKANIPFFYQAVVGAICYEHTRVGNTLSCKGR